MHKFPNAPDDEAVLWRYMRFERFAAMLSTGAVHFAPLTKFDDKFEGTVPRRIEDAWRAALPVATADCPPLESPRDRDARLRKNTFASCWHESSHESAAFWGLYSAVGGVAIRTTMGRLSQALGHAYGDRPFFVGRMNYENFDTIDPAWLTKNGCGTALLKRRSFDFEHEVRVLVYPRSTSADGIDAPVSLSTLFEHLFVSPLADASVCSAAESLLGRFGLSGVGVTKSDLWADNLY